MIDIIVILYLSYLKYWIRLRNVYLYIPNRIIPISYLSEYEYLDKEIKKYCSEAVHLVSEWRCYLLYGKIIYMCFYFGNPDVGWDMRIIVFNERIVHSYPYEYWETLSYKCVFGKIDVGFFHIRTPIILYLRSQICIEIQMMDRPESMFLSSPFGGHLKEVNFWIMNLRGSSKFIRVSGSKRLTCFGSDSGVWFSGLTFGADIRYITLSKKEGSVTTGSFF